MSSISGCTSREIVLETSWVYAVIQQRPQSIAVITPEEKSTFATEWSSQLQRISSLFSALSGTIVKVKS